MTTIPKLTARTARRLPLWILLVLLFGMPVVWAGDYDPHPVSKGKFGAKIGIMYSSKFRVDGVSTDADLGISFGVLLDLPVARRGVSGISAELHDLHIYKKRKKVLDLSVPVKYRFIFEDRRWELRPMAAAGFGYMTEVDELERTTFLTLKAGLEAVFHSTTRYSMIIDGLVFAAPSGGNADNRVTFGPTLLLRIGFIY